MDDHSCPICYEEFQDKVVLSSCRHEYCRACLAEHCQHQVATRNVPIRCPMCMGYILLDTVKQVLSTADFDRLQSLLQAQVEETNSGTTECPRCNHLNPSSTTSSSSSSSGGQLCLACGCRLPQDCPLSMALIQETTRPCSHCGIPIEKETGCDHVVCSWCRTDMCWSCGSHVHLRGDGPHRYCSRCMKGYIHHDREQAQIRRRQRAEEITAIETAMADLELMVDPEAREAAEEEIRRERIRRERYNKRIMQFNEAVQTKLVTIPPNIYPGMHFITSVDGQQLVVTCPATAGPNMTVRVVPPVKPARTEMQVFEVVVPQGAIPGQPFAVRANGHYTLTQCPRNASVGQRIRLRLPASPVLAREEARIRRHLREARITAVETAMADLEMLADPASRRRRSLLRWSHRMHKRQGEKKNALRTLFRLVPLRRNLSNEP